MNKKEIFTIVLTGGPYSGKSSLVPELKVFLERNGYKVFPYHETAREIINALPNTETNYPVNDFYRAVFKKQLEKEEEAKKEAENEKADKIAIIYDSALLDTKAYVDKSVFEAIKREFGFNSDKDILKRYDCVIHLETLAKVNAQKFISETHKTTSNLFETNDLDSKINRVWFLHPHRIYVGACKEWEEKIDVALYLLKNLLDERK